MTEMPVYSAILHALQPLCEYGFRFTRHSDAIFARCGWWCHEMPTRDIIEAMADGEDPCVLFAEAFDSHAAALRAEILKVSA